MGLGVVVGKEVGVGAAGAATVEGHAGAAGESHGEVVAVDHRDVVEVLAAAERELGQRHGRLPGEREGERASAVARLAAPAVAIEGAASPCGPTRGRSWCRRGRTGSTSAQGPAAGPRPLGWLLATP